MTARRSPPVSVVIVTRDRAALLADALAGVATQTAPPHEVIVGDDGITPLATPAWPGPAPLVWLRAAAGSAAIARNRAAARASGEWIAFLDDDDRWAPSHLAGLAGLGPGDALAYRDVAVIRERVTPEGVRVERERRVIAHDWDPERMRTDDYVPPSALFIRRALFETLGGFDAAMRYSEDWDLLLRAAAHTTPRRIPGVTVEVRMRDEGNLSAEHGVERRACLDALSARHGLPPLVIRTFWEVAGIVAASERGA